MIANFDHWIHWPYRQIRDNLKWRFDNERKAKINAPRKYRFNELFLLSHGSVSLSCGTAPAAGTVWLLVLSGCFFISLITAWTSQGVSLIMKSPYHSSATLKLLRLLCNRTIPIEFHMWVNGVWHWLFVSDTIFRPVQTIAVSQRHMLYDHVSNSRTTYKLPIHIVSQNT